MDALAPFRVRFDAVHGGFVGDPFAGREDGQVRARPHGLDSVAWLLRRVARGGGVAVNRFVAGRPRVLVAGNRNRRLGIGRTAAGPGMSPAKADDPDRRLDRTAVRGSRTIGADDLTFPDFPVSSLMSTGEVDKMGKGNLHRCGRS